MRGRVASSLLLIAVLLGACSGPPDASPASSASASGPISPTRPPNVVFILVDDLGWTDFGVYGSDLYETPNIDRLARDGMRFTDAYAAAAICSPTRVSILTGKYPARVRITDWIPGVRYPHAPLMTPAFCQEMALEEVTLAEALAPAGYTSLHVGKWHLGREPFYPLAQGFDVNVGGHAKGAPATYFHPYQAKTDARVDWGVRNLPEGGRDGDYLTDRLGAEAVRLIEANRDRPFFLHLSFYAVHTPIEGRPDLVAHYRARLDSGDGSDRRHANAKYAAMVHAVDENVGRVLDTLHRLGLADDTVVLLTSDNGGVTGITDNTPLRGGKGFLYEGGIREPLIARWPGVVPAGAICDAVVSSIDFYPMILEIAGATGDATHNRQVDGVSLLPVLLDPLAPLAREAVFWHYPHYHTPQRPPTGAVRAGDYKLLEFYEDGRLELYDLRADPGERDDLARQLPGTTMRLRRLLHDWRSSLDAQMPTPNPDHDPAKPFRNGRAEWDSVSPACMCPGGETPEPGRTRPAISLR